MTTTYTTPVKDQHHAIAVYWTGPLTTKDGAYNAGVRVTGFRRWGGARTDYYEATCTCTFKAVGPTRWHSQDGDALAAVDADALAHAATHCEGTADLACTACGSDVRYGNHSKRH